MEDMEFLPVVIWLVLAIFGFVGSKAKKSQHSQQKKPVVKSTRSRSQTTPKTTADWHRTIKPTIAPTVRVTAHTEDMFEGSMHAVTDEGYDPCHDGDLTPAINPCELAPAAQPAAAPAGIRLDWDSDALVKAVVMQEILTRPCDRVRH